MIKKLIQLTFLLTIFVSCKKGQVNKTNQLQKEQIESITSLANRYLELKRFSGSILIAKDGNVVYDQSFGLADYDKEIPFSKNTAFKIGEISQLITSDLVSRLIKEQKVSGTDKIANYLTEITSEHTINDFVKLEQDLDFNLAGAFIEKVTNKTYQENIETYGTELNLENTYYQKQSALAAIGYLYHNYRGQGLELQKSPSYDVKEAFSSKGLKSTPHDLLKIVHSQSKELAIEGYLETDGFSYSLLNDPEKKLTIIVLSNFRHPVSDEISNSIKAILEGKAYNLPLLRKPFDIDTSTLKDFAGNYALNEQVKFEVLISNDSLLVLLGPNKVHLVPQSSNQFYMTEMDASMRFLRDSTDMINKIALLNGFIDSDQIAIRINNSSLQGE
ncbi:MAG: serine hydrolase domain-containing protein [bacterium]